MNDRLMNEMEIDEAVSAMRMAVESLRGRPLNDYYLNALDAVRADIEQMITAEKRWIRPQPSTSTSTSKGTAHESL